MRKLLQAIYGMVTANTDFVAEKFYGVAASLRDGQKSSYQLAVGFAALRNIQALSSQRCETAAGFTGI